MELEEEWPLLREEGTELCEDDGPYDATEERHELMIPGPREEDWPVLLVPSPSPSPSPSPFPFPSPLPSPSPSPSPSPLPSPSPSPSFVLLLLPVLPWLPVELSAGQSHSMHFARQQFASLAQLRAPTVVMHWA